MLVLGLEDMVGYNVASPKVQKQQTDTFLKRLETNVPIHAKRAYRWANSPVGRYALYTASIWIFPQQKVKTAIRVMRKMHGIYSTSKGVYEDVKSLF